MNINDVCESCAMWADANRGKACITLLIAAALGFAAAYYWSRRLSKEARAILREIKDYALKNVDAGQVKVNTAWQRSTTVASVTIIGFRSRSVSRIVVTPNVTTFIHQAGLLLDHCGWNVTAEGSGWSAIPRESRTVRIQRLQPQPRRTARTAA